MAYRLGLAMAQDIAGLVLLNGGKLALSRHSFSRLKVVQGLPIFIGHGEKNPLVPLATARQTSRLLDNAGADVQMESYSTTHRIHPDMLRDVNRWIMGAVTTDPDALALASKID